MIRFDAKTQVVLSEHLQDDVPHLVNEMDAKAVSLFIDSAVSAHEEVMGLVKVLEGGGTLEKFNIQAIEPTTDMVNQYASELKKKTPDLLVGIGGGSIMDLTKAVSVMAIHEGLVEAYHGTRKPFLNAIPKVLIPSTSGTGSEVTPGAVLVNTKTKFKRGIGSRWISADYAVLNGRLTLSMPAHVTAATGMDALAHAIESYTARNANPISRMYSKEAFSLVFKNLDRIFDHPNDLSIRNNILLGSCLAGFAIYNSNTGACHALAYPLGIYHQIPHGVAVGQLITKVVEINIAKGCLDYADLFDLIEAPYKSELVGKVERDKKARSFGAVLKTYKPLQYLKRFEEYGLRHQDIPFLAERGLDLAPALSNNPVDFVIEDARIALTKALS